jgi:hypothetical protein
MIERKRIALIAPRLPPHDCGVGDYAWELSRHWPTSGAFHFFVTDGVAASSEVLQTEEITSFGTSGDRLVEQLETNTTQDVLLQYAGRAYQRFGAPRWLLTGLRKWRERDQARRLHVMFHELPASPSLLSKHGVAERFSTSVARGLAQRADTLITNSEQHAELLRRFAPAHGVEWLPVASNIPPPANESAPRTHRAGEFVIFGLPFNRLQTLRLYQSEIRRWLESEIITTLHLIGSRDEKFTAEIDALLSDFGAGDRVVAHGALSAPDVSKLLTESAYCLSAATPTTWSKSGTFMAYAAHGGAVVTKADQTSPPLSATIAASQLHDISAADVQNKRAMLRQWYQQNADWNVIAPRIAELISRR